MLISQKICIMLRNLLKKKDDQKNIINLIKNLNYENNNKNYDSSLVIALFLYDKVDTAEIILEILKKQNALKNLVIFIDGTQGSRNYDNLQVIEIVKSYNLKKVFINKG